MPEPSTSQTLIVLAEQAYIRFPSREYAQEKTISGSASAGPSFPLHGVKQADGTVPRA